MPIKSAFEGFQGTWFIRVHATRLQDIPPPTTCNPSPVQHDTDQSRKLREKQPFVAVGHGPHGVNDCSLSEIITQRDKDSSLIVGEEQPKFRKKHKRKRIAKELEGNTIANNLNCKSSVTGHPLEEAAAAPSVNVSENIISVTGILSRYFSDYDEVDSCEKEHKHKLEESHKSEMNYSTTKEPEYSVCQTSREIMMGSESDSVCSSNSITASDKKQVKATVIRVKRSSEVKRLRKGSKLMVSTPISHKLHVGNKLVQAANNISVSCSGKKSSKTMFTSRCRNLSLPESNVARRIAFELDDFDD